MSLLSITTEHHYCVATETSLRLPKSFIHSFRVFL